LHELVGHLIDELVQTGEAHIGLVLNSAGADDLRTQSVGLRGDTVEKCRLAHSGFACQQERRTIGPGPGQEGVDGGEFTLATEESVRVVVQLSHGDRSRAPPRVGGEGLGIRFA
jgi:hypothetical protein